MVRVRQAAALAAASFSAVAHAGAIPDFADLAGNGAPLPSIPAAFANGLQKRQISGGFLDTDGGPPIASNCNEAATFALNNLGQLLVDNSVISMNPGTPFIPLRPISPQGSVTVTFSLNNGALSWSNPAFFGGQAGFCQDITGQVFATFANPAVAYPPNCIPIRLGPVVASTCQNGAIVSSSGLSIPPPPGTRVTTVGTTIVSSGPNGSVFSTVTSFATTLNGPGPITTVPGPIPSGSDVAPTPVPVVNGTLTLRPGLYTEAGFVTPGGSVCRVVTESWIFGQTTLLPPVTTAA